MDFGVLFGAGLGDFIILILFVVFYLFFYIIRASSTANEAQEELEKEKNNNEQNINIATSSKPFAEQGITYTTESKKKRNLRKPQPQLSIETIDNSTKNQKETRKALARELPQQGHGARFEAAPGTLNTVQLAPTVEATVNPELNSLTGIYDQSPQPINDNYQPENLLNIYEILTTPEGIRNFVILSEILNRPNFDK
jgi:hypothetical protein